MEVDAGAAGERLGAILDSDETLFQLVSPAVRGDRQRPNAAKPAISEQLLGECDARFADRLAGQLRPAGSDDVARTKRHEQPEPVAHLIAFSQGSSAIPIPSSIMRCRFEAGAQLSSARVWSQL